MSYKKPNTIGTRELVAINVYNNVLTWLQELRHQSNATETIFVNEIQNFVRDKIKYYESGEGGKS